jgi:hypothetical protein
MKTLWTSVAIFALGAQAQSCADPYSRQPAQLLAEMPSPPQATQMGVASAPSITFTPTFLTTMPTMAVENFHPPSPTLKERGGLCPGDLIFCNGPSNCCSPSSYCTVDSRGVGACCANGAVCTGISNPVPGIITSGMTGAGASAGNALRPARIFGIPFALTHHGANALGLSQNKTAIPAPESKFVGGNADMILQTSAMSGAAGFPRPWKLFSLIVGLANRARAAFSCGDAHTSNQNPKLKFIGANPGLIKAEQAHTSGASESARPPRLFSFPIALVSRMKGAFALGAQCEGIINTETSPLVTAGNVCLTSVHNETEDHKGLHWRGGGGGGGGWWSGSASLQPPRLFSLPVALLDQGMAAIASTVQWNGRIRTATDPSVGAGTTYSTLAHDESEGHRWRWPASMRPPRLFAFVVALAKRVKAAISST